jgi:hypothetical protein
MQSNALHTVSTGSYGVHNMPANSLPPALAEIARGRDHVATSEYAHVIHKAPQTLRKEHSRTGECYGIRPVKIGNRLLWPVARIAVLLREGHK